MTSAGAAMVKNLACFSKLDLRGLPILPINNYVAKKPDGLRAELGVSETTSNLKIKGVNYEVFKKGNFTHLSRDAHPVTHNQAHFDVVNHVWPRELQAR
jgi:hypothetical protein